VTQFNGCLRLVRCPRREPARGRRRLWRPSTRSRRSPRPLPEIPPRLEGV